MRLRTLTMVRRPPSPRGVPPRYQVFDRRKQPPMTIGVFYRIRETVVFEVYDDFREFLKQELDGRRFDWILDVDPDAPGDDLGDRETGADAHPRAPGPHGRAGADARGSARGGEEG